MRVEKVVILVFGIIVLLVAVVPLLAGGTLVWVDKALKDSEGFINTEIISLERDSHAIITHPADIDLEGNWPWDWCDLAMIKVKASSNDLSKQIFMGIAEDSDVEDYLSDVEYDEIAEFRIYLYGVDYKNHPGSSVPADPASQTFWRVSTYGAGTQTLKWELEKGTWVLVLMNTDGSAVVDLSGSVGVKVTWIFGLGIGLLSGGTFVLIIGIVIVYYAVRRQVVRSETK